MLVLTPPQEEDSDPEIDLAPIVEIEILEHSRILEIL